MRKLKSIPISYVIEVIDCKNVIIWHCTELQKLQSPTSHIVTVLARHVHQVDLRQQS